MTQYDEFYGPGYETSSGPVVIVDVLEADIWPVADNSESTTKDAVGDGLHPVVAVGGRTAADGRPLNLTGVVISWLAGLTVPTGRIALNIANGYIIKNYVANVLTYAATIPDTFETAPVIGQAVYVDDSDDLGEGCTLSLSELNEDDVPNPFAGVLWYDQTEYVDFGQGGPNIDALWPKTWANSYDEKLVCILQINGARDV